MVLVSDEDGEDDGDSDFDNRLRLREGRTCLGGVQIA
jgi:hypothetical protein